MKKVSVILMMMGFVLPSWAQLGFRTLWEKPFGNVLYSEFVRGARPVSQQLTKEKWILNIYYGACMSKCSTVVVNRIISADSSLKMEMGYYLGFGLGSKPFKNNHYITTESYLESQTQKNYYASSVYDPNFNLKTTFRNFSTYHLVNLFTEDLKRSFTPISDGGFFVSLQGREFNKPDTLIRFNSNNQVLWKYNLQSLYRQQDTTFYYTQSELPYHWDDESAYIAKKEVRDKTYSNIILSSQKRLVAVDSLGKEKWTATIDTSNNNYKIVGIDAQSQWVLFTKKDSTGRLLKFDGKGNKTSEISLALSLYYDTQGLTFQSTPDNGFLLIKNYYTTEMTKFNAAGKKEWDSARLSSVDKIKVYPDGNIIGYSLYTPEGYRSGGNVVFLLSSNGTVILTTEVANLVVSADGWFYFTTNEKLYAVNPKGEIGWMISKPASHANVSQDKDGGILLSETIETPNPTAANYMKLTNLAVITTHKLSKYSKEGKLIWQMPIQLPVTDSTRQVRFLGGVYPSTDGNYVVPHVLTSLSPNANMGKLDNFSQVSSLLKITRPCYQRIDATLKTSTTTLCTGQKLQLTSNTDTLNLLSYQWQRDGQVLSTTRASVFEATAAGAYRVTVRDSVCGTSFLSNTVNVVTRSIQTPSVTSSGSTDFCAGSDFATLTATSVHPDLRYQWMRNGQALSDTFQNSLKVTELGIYQLSAFDMVCNATVLSSDIVVKVRPLPEAVVTPEISGVVYAPFKAKLRANEGSGLSYQWFKEGVELAGATSSVYEAGESGNYAVRVSREGCSQLSQTVGITILQPLGVETTVKEEFQVFPNPNRGDFEVRLPTGWEKAEIQLIDMIGRSLPLTLTGRQVRVKAIAGMYLLRIKLAEKELSKRVVIVPF